MDKIDRRGGRGVGRLICKCGGETFKHYPTDKLSTHTYVCEACKKHIYVNSRRYQHDGKKILLDPSDRVSFSKRFRRR